MLLGEASHGTHEFYRERAEITRRLIREKGFTAVAVEADWPDAYRVNRYRAGRGSDADAEPRSAASALPDLDVAQRRRARLRRLAARATTRLPDRADAKAGFYGLDLYSLHASMEAVLSLPRQGRPRGRARARYRYACFDHFGEDPQAYGYAARFGLAPVVRGRGGRASSSSCSAAPPSTPNRDGRVAEDELLLRRAERAAGHERRGVLPHHVPRPRSSWNLRDSHMADTLDALVEHLDAGRRGRRSSSGRTTPTSATPAPPRWAAGAS